jgi:E3 ubiquitin-protein ligase NEDD4
MFTQLTGACRRANEESILAVQIFDQKKFKKKDQGFLGVVNVRVGSVIDLDAGGDGAQNTPSQITLPLC